MKLKLPQVLQQSREKVYKRWFRFINYIPKRVRIVASTLFMTGLLLVTTFFPFTESWYYFIPLIIVTSYLATYIAIFEGIDGVEWYMLFIMPVLLTLALYLFFSLLPVRWLTRLPYLVLFSLTYYAILLTSNIFNIGVEKSLQLFRAAFSVNYLFQTFMVFLLMLVTLSFKQNFFVNALSVAIFTSLLAAQLFWTVNPNDTLQKEVVRYGNGVGLLMTELAIILSFLPLKTNVAALVCAATYYTISGIIYHHLDGRLYKNVAREYIFVFACVIFIAMLTLQW